MHPFVSLKHRKLSAAVALALVGMAAAPMAALGQVRDNRACVDPAGEAVFYNPGNGEDIVVPRGYKVELFAKDLNFPTGIAFVGNKDRFNVVVLESGTGLPGACNNNDHPVWGGKFSPTNPFTPNITIFDQDGTCLAGRADYTTACRRGPIGKPGSSSGSDRSCLRTRLRRRHALWHRFQPRRARRGRRRQQLIARGDDQLRRQ
jgi:hypothetical protein